jgi:ferredoxin
VTRGRWKKVRVLRVVLSLLFFTLFTLMFTDAWHLFPRNFTVLLASLQIVPAILKVVTVGGGVAAAGLALVVGVTLLVGRVYCSTVCPLGVLQDVMFRVARKINRRMRFKYNRAPQWLHYSVLAVSVVLVLLGGTMIIGDLLEPFSNFGRMVNAFILPAAVLTNNAIADVLGNFGIYFLYNIQLHLEGIGALSLGVLFFVTLGYLSMTDGRLFCNSFCPAGAILSLLSRMSLYRLVIAKEVCNDCGACDKVCKAECIDSATKQIDFSACVGCFNCVRSCPEEAISYERRPLPDLQPADAGFDRGRREFFRNITLPTAAFLVAPGIVKGGGALIKEAMPVTPPGSLSIAHFTSVCTACHLCVTSCPTGVLQPSFLEFGFSGMFQPKMDYSVNYCNYDCVICGEVCPTGAIVPLDVPAKKLVQIGKTTFKKDDCVVVSKKKDCAACSEHCPTKAVHTIPYENGLFLPEVDDELCIGCGACEHACPVTPRKAILVTANEVHLKARKPDVKKAEGPVPSVSGDFPF